MKIEKNFIFIGEEKNFSLECLMKLRRLVWMALYLPKMSPDEEGDGHIILRRQMFYGLKEPVPFIFKNRS